MKSYFVKISQMTVIGAATVSLSLVSAIPVFGGQLAPKCIATVLDDSGWTDYLSVYSSCKNPERIKVVLANSTDFACRTIKASGYLPYSWNYPGRFDKIESC